MVKYTQWKRATVIVLLYNFVIKKILRIYTSKMLIDMEKRKVTVKIHFLAGNPFEIRLSAKLKKRRNFCLTII